MDANQFDVVIVGGGPAGLAAACLIAAQDRCVAVVAGSNKPPDDPRTVALMQPAIRLLSYVGAWPGLLAGDAAPLRKLRLVDDTGSSLSAPEILFDANELGGEPFGWNFPISRLVPVLRQVADAAYVRCFDQDATDFAAGHEQALVKLSDGQALAAPLVIAADGRASRVRVAAGIGTEEWSYDQSAIATSFSHSASHHDTSSEYHRPGGPFTTVPLPGRRSSLVWMERTDQASALMSLSNDDLAREIQLATHGKLGRIGEIGARRLFPMRGLRANRLIGNRLILIGEAAHVVPPIGAQGLNMSLRDAAEAADIVGKFQHPGTSEGLFMYEASRRQDILPRQAVIDLMNRSLLGGLLWMDGGRAASLTALSSFSPLRRFVMKRGLAPSGALPTAMRPPATSFD